MQKKTQICIINCFEKYPCKNPILHDTDDNKYIVFDIGWQLNGIGLRAYDLSSSFCSPPIKKAPEKALTAHCKNGALKYIVKKWINELNDDSLIIIRVMLSERICLSLPTLIETIGNNLKGNQKISVLAEFPKLNGINARYNESIQNEIIKSIIDYLEPNRKKLIHWFLYEDVLNERMPDFRSIGDMQFYLKPNIFIISSNLIKPSFCGVYDTYLKPYELPAMSEKDNLVKGAENTLQFGYITKYDPYDVFRMFSLKLKDPEGLYSNF